DPQKGILLFPTKNVKRLSCIWFSLIHVKNTKSVGGSKTEVSTSFGHTILLDMNESCFITRWNKALELKARISKHLKCPIHFYVEPIQDFYISKRSNGNNYTL
ncbi:competence protein ComK, partial [Neobacillus niacini]|uniref:competence protein ComK n=1 Tax=Neobacillus niacini TaxID=86668 RepID=UPI003002AA81